MNVTILGGGFGLYGYLPALLQLREVKKVLLPMRYQKPLLARQDIASFYNDVEWIDDQLSILERCEGVIFALPPAQQYIWAKKCLEHPNISHLFLEKPLAPSPILADELLNALQNSKKKFRIGYNFRYTTWGKTLLTQSQSIENIVWSFLAHHYEKNIQTWKRNHQEGGGALRFYGIHLIAILAELGYNEVNLSKIKGDLQSEIEDWEAVLTGPGLRQCKISIATNTNNKKFIVHKDKDLIFSDIQPFATPQKIDNVLDQRVPFLAEGLTDLFSKSEQYYDWYEHANLLWHKIETSL